MRSSALLFSLLPLLAQSHALPSPQVAGAGQSAGKAPSANSTNEVDPLAPQMTTIPGRARVPQIVLPPGPTPCKIVDPECDCVLHELGDFHMYCGYVDADWHSVGKRSASPSAGASSAAAKKPANGTNSGTSPKPINPITWAAIDKGVPHGVLNGSQKAAAPLKVTYAKDATTAAVGILKAFGALKGALAVIRNRVQPEMRGKYVQGVRGTLIEGAKNITTGFADPDFPAGTLWEARWDFSWLQADGSPPATGVLGPHIVIRIQAPTGSKGSIALAIYPENAKNFKDIPVPGDHYFTEILARLNDVAHYVQAEGAYAGSEIGAAQAIIADWTRIAG